MGGTPGIKECWCHNGSSFRSSVNWKIGGKSVCRKAHHTEIMPEAVHTSALHFLWYWYGVIECVKFCFDIDICYNNSRQNVAYLLEVLTGLWLQGILFLRRTALKKNPGDAAGCLFWTSCVSVVYHSCHARPLELPKSSKVVRNG